MWGDSENLHSFRSCICLWVDCPNSNRGTRSLIFSLKGDAGRLPAPFDDVSKESELESHCRDEAGLLLSYVAEYDSLFYRGIEREVLPRRCSSSPIGFSEMPERALVV